MSEIVMWALLVPAAMLFQALLIALVLDWSSHDE